MRSVILIARTITLPRNNLLFLAALFVWLSFLGCEQPAAPVPREYRIVFPNSGIQKAYGTPTLFQASGFVEWYSSIDAYLGTGESVLANLSIGDHKITIRRDGIEYDTVNITVIPVTDDNEYMLIIQGASPRIFLPSGEYSPYCISLYNAQTKVSFSLSSMQTTRQYGRSAASAEPRPLDIPPDKLFTPGLSGPIKNRSVRSIARNLALHTERSFHFVDLSGTGNTTELTASLKSSSVNLDVWVDNAAVIDDSVFRILVDAIENHVLPRHTAVWGSWRDVDGNGKISMLMTPRFNQTRKAIGIFNPADFYPNNTDIKSPNYNPLSNEMDIVYVGVPDSTGADPAFSIASLLATIAHETQHLKSFSVVVNQQESCGAAEPEMEETFLEEGLAHFAENIAGYGLSGGNMAFISRYLDKPEATALSSYIGVGFGDSVERRGGMALLIGYLFQEFGGVQFKDDGSITDSGGISFLRRIYASRKRGWERLEDASGYKRETILKQFADFLNKPFPVVALQDPITSEPTQFDPYLGMVTSLGKTYNLMGPKRIDFYSSFTVAPYTLAFGSSFILPKDTCIDANVAVSVNQIYAYFPR